MHAPIEASILQSALFDFGIDIGRATNIYADDRYVSATPAWIAGTYCRDLRGFQDYLDVHKYVSESNDCDDFAMAATYFAHLCFMATPDRPKDCALAVSPFWYLPETGGGHAIVLFAAREPGGVLEPVFVEPQGPQVVTLTKKEINSCTYVCF